MPTRKRENENIRKLTKVGGKTIAVTIPIELVRALKWKEKQRVIVKRQGNGLIIKDFKP